MIRVLALLLLITVFAGCQGGADAGPDSLDATSPTAAVPTANESAGSLAGKVVDEELRPIPSARVGVVGPNTQTATDATGAYTINGVAPGKYAVVAEGLGYTSVSRSIEVIAGQVSYVNFTLAALAIAEPPHHVAVPKTSHIQAEQGFVAQEMEYQRLVNLTPVRSVMCGNCFHVLYIERDPVQVITENQWAESAVNTVMETRYMWNRTGTGATDLGTFQWGRLANRQAMTWSDANIASLSAKKVTQIEVTVTASQLGVSFDHKIETWTTFAYGATLPDGFSALAPP